jgi:hypothetical protein
MTMNLLPWVVPRRRPCTAVKDRVTTIRLSLSWSQVWTSIIIRMRQLDREQRAVYAGQNGAPVALRNMCVLCVIYLKNCSCSLDCLSLLIDKVCIALHFLSPILSPIAILYLHSLRHYPQSCIQQPSNHVNTIRTQSSQTQTQKFFICQVRPYPTGRL